MQIKYTILNLLLFISLSGNAQISASVIVSSPTCFGAANGSIIINYAGGSPPYGVYIMNDQNDTINNFPSGNTVFSIAGGAYYYYSVVDGSGANLYDSVFLSQPDSIEFMVNLTQPNLPPDQGGIDITNILNIVYPAYVDIVSSNGGAPFNQIIVSPTPISYPNLDTGTYFLQVVDDNGCTNSMQVVIAYQSPIPPVSFNLNIDQPLSTPGVGSLEIQNIQGNISPQNDLEITVTDANAISYPLTGLLCDNLGPGVYTVTVTDTLSTMSNIEVATLEFQDLGYGDAALNNLSISNINAGSIAISGLKSADFCQLFNASSQLVASFNGNENAHIFSLPEGFYVLSVSRGGQQYSKAFICR